MAENGVACARSTHAANAHSQRCTQAHSDVCAKCFAVIGNNYGCLYGIIAYSKRALLMCAHAHIFKLSHFAEHASLFIEPELISVCVCVKTTNEHATNFSPESCAHSTRSSTTPARINSAKCEYNLILIPGNACTAYRITVAWFI